MTRRSLIQIRRASAGMRMVMCAAMLTSGTGPALRAQPAAPGLGIEEVIAATLKDSPDIQVARAIADAERGALVQAARPFDPRPAATLASHRIAESSGLDLTQTASSSSTLETESRLSVSKMFRSGVTVGSQAAITRTSLRALDRTTLNQFTLTNGLTLPLMQGRGGGLFTALERAAALDHRASERALRAAAGTAVRDVTVAYWEYRASHRRADILRAAARRSRQSVDEVKILIAADERPQSDIDLMIANTAAKHVNELEADRQIVLARHALALTMGFDAAAAAALGNPSTEFPDVDGMEPMTLDVLTADALAHHDALAVLSMRKESAGVRRDGAASHMKPRVDLQLEAGYTGANRGEAVGRTFGSVFGDVLGPNVSVQFVFEPSNVNSSLRGALLEANAAYAQETVASDRLTRAIRLEVANALTSVTSSRAQLASTREAIARARLALETVQRNFELGTATIFDRILAEDTLTNAELADLSANLRHATALVNLQFARGVLIDGDGRTFAADPARVLRAKREDAR